MMRQSRSKGRHSVAWRNRALSVSKTFFDWIEVGAVGRQVEQAYTCSFDHLADPWSLGAGHVVHDNDGAWRKVGDEDLLDLDFDGIAINRSVEDPGAMMPLQVIPATKVVVFQWPRGIPTDSGRSSGPYWSRPRSRR